MASSEAPNPGQAAPQAGRQRPGRDPDRPARGRRRRRGGRRPPRARPRPCALRGGHEEHHPRPAGREGHGRGAARHPGRRAPAVHAGGGPTPAVILMAGVQGSGKTTACAKLALHLKGKGRRPLLVGADLDRPARGRTAPDARPRDRHPGVVRGPRPRPPGEERREGGGPVGRRRRDHRHGRPSPRGPGHDAAGPAHPRRDEAGPRRHGVRRDDGTGRGGAGARVHARGRHDGLHPHQARRRRPRRRGAVDDGGHGAAGVLRGDRGEGRRPRALLPRPHGGADPRDGRRAHPDREGTGDRSTRRPPRPPRSSSCRAGSPSRTSSSSSAR